jgi:hypothetical protein
MAIKMPRASGYVRRLAQGHREAERGYAVRDLVSKSMADDGRSNKGQREERG